MAAGAAIHAETQGQAVFEEGAREKVEVGGQVFGGIDACADAAAAAIIEHVEQREHGTVGPAAVRRRVEPFRQAQGPEPAEGLPESSGAR